MEKMEDPGPHSVETFIKEVEKKQALYDKNHPSFNDKAMKEKIWEDIGKKHAMTASQSKKYWRSICTRYITALRVVTETKYIPQERILHRQNLKFMENHLKDFVLDPFDEKLATEITQEIKLEIEKDKENNNDGIPKNLQTILRQVKLKKWTDTSLMKKYHPDKISQYRRMVDAMVEIIKEAIRRREATMKKHKQRQTG